MNERMNCNVVSSVDDNLIAPLDHTTMNGNSIIQILLSFSYIHSFYFFLSSRYFNICFLFHSVFVPYFVLPLLIPFLEETRASLYPSSFSRFPSLCSTFSLSFLFFLPDKYACREDASRLHTFLPPCLLPIISVLTIVRGRIQQEFYVNFVHFPLKPIRNFQKMQGKQNGVMFSMQV